MNEVHLEPPDDVHQLGVLLLEVLDCALAVAPQHLFGAVCQLVKVVELVADGPDQLLRGLEVVVPVPLDVREHYPVQHRVPGQPQPLPHREHLEALDLVPAEAALDIAAEVLDEGSPLLPVPEHGVPQQFRVAPLQLRLLLDHPPDEVVVEGLVLLQRGQGLVHYPQEKAAQLRQVRVPAGGLLKHCRRQPCVSYLQTAFHQNQVRLGQVAVVDARLVEHSDPL